MLDNVTSLRGSWSAGRNQVVEVGELGLTEFKGSNTNGESHHNGMM